jgi:hypothetical protein
MSGGFGKKLIISQNRHETGNRPMVYRYPIPVGYIKD